MSQPLFLYMSQWSMHGGAPGLSLFTFDQENGALHFERQLNDHISFGCSLIDYNKNILYLCNEDDLEREAGYHTGRIYGYSIDPQTGDLTELFHQDTFCPCPDYVNFTPDRRFMIVPHHSLPGSVTTIQQDANGRYFPVTTCMDSAIDLFCMKADGTIDHLSDVRKHVFAERTTDFQGRMTIPHPHCAVLSPSGRIIAVCDKGDGKLYMYQVNEADQKLEELSRTLTDVPLSEPRYCSFHPSQPWLFVNHEHTGHGRMPVCAFCYSEDGDVQFMNKVDSLPQDYSGAAEGQGFCMSGDGKYLYNLLQGPNAVAVLSVDQNTGALSVLQHMPVEGARVRHCALSPNGRFLVTACLSGEISVYAVEENGLLSPTPHKAFLKGSAYIQFYHP